MPTLTDDEKQKMLSEGTAIEFGPWSDEVWSNRELLEARVIHSDWINALVDADETVCVPIRIDGAMIRGRLQLEYVTFQRLVSITNTAFEDEVEVSYATFKRTARFDGSGFRKPVNFHDVHVERNFEVNGAQFPDRSEFSDLRVDGFLLSKVARYGGSVTFVHTVVSKDAYFDGAEFFGEARLWSMQIKGQAIFLRAKFHTEAIFVKTKFEHDAVFFGTEFVGDAKFDGVSVAGDFLLKVDGEGSSTRFMREARFVSIRVQGQSLFNGCYFGGVASFTGASFGAEVSFQGAEFRSIAVFERIRCGSGLSFGPSQDSRHVAFGGPVRFVYAHIAGEADFTGVEFLEKADFDGCHIDGNVVFASSGLQNVYFRKLASFVQIRWAGQARFEGAQFVDDVSFDGAEIKGNAYFNPDSQGRRVSFGGRASFLGTQIGGQVSFDQAVFKKQALFINARFDAEAAFRGTQFMDDASFDRIEIKAGAQFHADTDGNGVRFVGSVRFHGSLVRSQLSFLSAQFIGDVSFDSMSVDGNFFLCPDERTPDVPPHFKERVVFNGSRFSGVCEFRAVAFDKEARFELARFGGPVRFSTTDALPGAMSFRRVSFAGSTFESTAHFIDTKFLESTEFESACFRRGFGFKNCDFEKLASFRSVVATGDAAFRNVLFKDDVTFRGSRFETFTLALRQSSQDASAAQLGGKVDLRGLTYDRSEIPWTLLFESLEPFNVQSYIQLERVLRAAGEDREADAAYLHRRKRERKRLWTKSEWPRAVWNFVQWVLFRYGVKPYQLLGFSLVFLALGLFVFSRSGAVMYKQIQFQTAEPVQLSISQGIFFSISQFLPIPLESLWQPASTFALVYSIIHRLAGFVLVPLGVAALAGLLHRREYK